MSTHRTSLDGVWDFQIHPEKDPSAIPAGEWRSAIVPMPWQAQFEDLRETSGVAWYRRHFRVEPDSLPAEAGSAILHFGAVDYHATIWLNGKLVGEHEGGYLPFEFDIMDGIREGDNVLLVKVVDPTDDRQIYATFPFGEIPHGKQSWYGPLGGIWQSVWLEFRRKLHLVRLQLDPLPQDGRIGVQVVLSEALPGNGQVTCRVTNPSGETAGSGTLDQSLTGVVRLDAPPELWSPDSPALYTLTADLRLDGVLVHSLRETCGFRTIETRAGRIYLNGHPIYLRGALDQGYYPETIYTPGSLELLEEQARVAKALGFNCLRIHIKVEDPRYYEVADRLGLLIWAEIPSWGILTEASAERARRTFDGMLERDGHHPSIIAWTLVNENWGTDLSRNEEHRRWLNDFYRYAKSADPTRLVIDNSACIGNAHVASDLEDFHYYRVIPDHAREWDEWVAEFAGRPDWTWFSDFSRKRPADLPLLVSEFGNWGLPDPEAIQEHGAEPWWFETGFDWAEGIVCPHDVKHRYEVCGLADLFFSYSEFTRHAQEHMARSLHYEISSMRLHEAIAGYIVTEFTDVHWECNGLLTMQREPKCLLDPLVKDLNQDQVIVLRPRQWSGRPGETVEVTVRTLGVAGIHREGRVLWQAESQTGELPAPGGELSLTLERPGMLTLTAKWLAKDGTQLAANEVSLVCVSNEPVSASLHVIADPALADVLRDLGYRVSDGNAGSIPDEALVIASSYTRSLETHVQSGGRVLLLAGQTMTGGSDDSVALPVGYIAPRANSVWQGDWANSLAWIKKQGPFAHLPGGPLLEMEWANLMPEAVLAGMPAWVQRSHSWAGLAVGWLHRAVSLLTVMPYGRGHILITTFKLNATTLATDTIAQALFAGMLKLM